MFDWGDLQGFQIDVVVDLQGPREQPVDLRILVGQLAVTRRDLGQLGFDLETVGFLLAAF